MKSQGNSTPSTAAVDEMETAWIPLSDGCRLAARIWLPADAEERPVGALMEYIPYRRRDLRHSEPKVSVHSSKGKIGGDMRTVARS